MSDITINSAKELYDRISDSFTNYPDCNSIELFNLAVITEKHNIGSYLIYEMNEDGNILNIEDEGLLINTSIMEDFCKNYIHKFDKSVNINDDYRYEFVKY